MYTAKPGSGVRAGEKRAACSRPRPRKNVSVGQTWRVAAQQSTSVRDSKLEVGNTCRMGRCTH